MKKGLMDKVGSIFNVIFNMITSGTKKEINLLKKAASSTIPHPLKLADGKSKSAAKRKDQSKLDSQGTGHFSGSAYNGPGNIDHGKIRSNKKRR